MTSPPEPPRRAGLWLDAARPKTLPAAIAPVLVGVALAVEQGGFHALAAACALLGAVLIQIGTNFSNDAQDFVRLVMSRAVETPIDKQGRILLPQYLREHAHIEKDVTFAGVGHTVEIWNTSRLEESLEQTQVNFPALSRGMAEKLRS